MGEESANCPKCGGLVTNGDTFCKHCGADLSTVNITHDRVHAEPIPVPPSGSAESAPYQPPYERKFSMLQRFYKIITSPKEAMQDIAKAPDYSGVIIIIILQTVVASVAIFAILQKFQFIGPSSTVSATWSILSGGLSLSIVIYVVLLFAFWLGKSLLIMWFCNAQSGWKFTTAAAVTGYSYLADVVFAAIGTVFGWIVSPTLVIDVSNETAARLAIAQYQETIAGRFLYTVPVMLVGLIWKSYLGGIGAHFGTDKRSPKLRGILVFLILGLIGLVISEAGNPGL